MKTAQHEAGRKQPRAEKQLVVAFRVDPELRRMLHFLKADTGVSVQEMCRQALRDYVAKSHWASLGGGSAQPLAGKMRG